MVPLAKDELLTAPSTKSLDDRLSSAAPAALDPDDQKDGTTAVATESESAVPGAEGLLIL